MKIYTEILLILQQYMLDGFGPHYPKEIVKRIVLIHRKITKQKIRCGYNYTILIKNGIHVWEHYDNEVEMPDTYRYPNISDVLNKLTLDNIKKIKNGYEHIIVLDTYGKLYEFYTYNSSGKIISNIDKIIKIDCGKFHTVALTIKNELYVWGKIGMDNWAPKTKNHVNFHKN